LIPTSDADPLAGELIDSTNIHPGYTRVEIKSKFILKHWPPQFRTRNQEKMPLSETEIVRCIDAILREMPAELPALTLDQMETLLTDQFPDAPKRKMREIYREHSPTRATRGRKSNQSEINQWFSEFRRKFTTADLNR